MKSENTRRCIRFLFYGINIVLPLLIGGAVYIAVLGDTYITGFISRIVGIQFRQIVLPAWLEYIARNFLSDFLWAYSLAFALSILFRYSRRNTMIVLGTSLFFIVTIELLQKTRAFSGTFDVIDILLESIAILLALFFIKLFEEVHNEKRN